MANSVAIFSLEADLHAHAVLQRLRSKGIPSEFIPTDDQFGSGGLSFSPGVPSRCQIRTADGGRLDAANIDVVWWRRSNQPQVRVPDAYSTEAAHLIDNEWRAALYGALSASFKGVWINDPQLDALAGNKAFQLQAALTAGFRVPATLVSQDPAAVRAFCELHGGLIIAKKLVGAPPKPLATVEVRAAQLTDDEAISACPTIYQEKIVGGKHLRIHYFGGRLLTALIESSLLDWRRDLSVPMNEYQLPQDVEIRIGALMNSLGLRIGIIDMMITNQDEFVWIELNTQGQFLFIEALAGMDLTEAMAKFLATAR